MTMKPSKRIIALPLLIFFFVFTCTTSAWSRADRVFFGIPGPISEEERATIGPVIGVTYARFMPEVKFETFAKGKASGTARGGVEGLLLALSQMGHCSGDFCAVAVLFWIATAGAVGAVYGAITGYLDTLPAEEVEKIERSKKQFFEKLAFQEQFADRLVRTAQQNTIKRIVKLDMQGPVRLGEDADYSSLKSENISSVLEVTVTEIGFETPPREVKFDRKAPPLHLVIKVDAKLLRISDGKILYHPRVMKIESRPFRKVEWEEDNSRRFLEQVDITLNALAEKIVDDVFLTMEVAVHWMHETTPERLYDARQ
jgi:hypothetical protein